MSDVAQEFQKLQSKVETIRTQRARVEGELSQLAAQLAQLGIENPEAAPAAILELEAEANTLEEFLNKRVAYLSKKLEG